LATKEINGSESFVTLQFIYSVPNKGCRDLFILITE